MSGFEDKLNAILGDREAMGQIMALAQSLGKQEERQEQTQPEQQESEAGFVPVWTQQETDRNSEQNVPDLSGMLGSIDPKMMQIGMRLLQEYNSGDDRNTALLVALRPFIKEERFAKVDRAIQIARLSRVVRVLFDTMKEKGGGGLV